MLKLLILFFAVFYFIVVNIQLKNVKKVLLVTF